MRPFFAKIALLLGVCLWMLPPAIEEGPLLGVNRAATDKDSAETRGYRICDGTKPAA